MEYPVNLTNPVAIILGCAALSGNQASGSVLSEALIAGPEKVGREQFARLFAFSRPGSVKPHHLSGRFSDVDGAQ